MTNDEKCLEMTGAEMVALAGSVSIFLSKKLTPKEICLMRTLFQSIASNLSTIEYTENICRTKNLK